MCRLHAEVLMLGVRQAWIDLHAVFTASPSGRHIALPESCRGGSRQVPRESGTFRFRGIEMARALSAAVDRRSPWASEPSSHITKRRLLRRSLRTRKPSDARLG